MRRRLPSLNALRTFEAAARHCSFKLAAKELRVTESAVSRQIRNLEVQLGARLFERLNRRVRLTKAGESFLPTLSTAFDDIASATGRIFPDLAQPVRSKRLQIAAETSVGECWLRPRLGKFRRAHPQVEIEVLLTDGRQVYPCDQADIVVHYGSGSWPGLHTELLMTLTEFPVCSRELANGNRPLRKPTDLCHWTLLHEDTTSLWELWLKGAGANEIDWTIGPIFHNSALCLDSAIAGDGVALGDELVAGDHLLGGRLVKPFCYNRPADAALYLLILPELLDLEEVSIFREWLHTEIKQFVDACRQFGKEEPYPQNLVLESTV